MANPTNQDIDLVGVRTKAYGKAMLHQTRDENGASTMVMVNKVVVPAHGTARFSPGNYHVMLEQAAKPLKRGMTITMTLLFGNGQNANVKCKIEGPDAMSWQ
ncbi:Copper chaperone PCu(A)C OS=Castellaniella defragrans OX=75697 GN=HNR28_002649 PE=4 SV=1 [Castellaniella defragrans]